MVEGTAPGHLGPYHYLRPLPPALHRRPVARLAGRQGWPETVGQGDVSRSLGGAARELLEEQAQGRALLAVPPSPAGKDAEVMPEAQRPLRHVRRRPADGAELTRRSREEPGSPGGLGAAVSPAAGPGVLTAETRLLVGPL